jgi:hypothetical protein
MHIGWDIGIKNLSYCIIDDDSKIKDWGIIDITDNEEHKCGFITQKAKVCGKVAKKIDKNTKKMYCNMHSKKLDCHDILTCFDCKNKAKKKNKENEFYCLKHSKNKEGMYDIKFNLKDLNNIGNKLIVKLNEKKEALLNVKNIVIENQPVLKNPTMKSIQIILYTYYLMNKLGDDYTIKLVPANSKLKFDITTPRIEEIKKMTNKYQKNKKLSIEYCRHFIKDDKKLLEYFDDFKKKDDLADSFLLIYYKLNKT